MEQEKNSSVASTATTEHHVHFDQSTILKDNFETDNSVTYQKIGDNTVVVHLGFLQISHRYLIELKLPINLFKCIDDPVILVPDTNNCKNNDASNSKNIINNNNHNNSTDDSIPNIHCKLIEFTGRQQLDQQQSTGTTSTTSDEEFYNLKVEYFAHKEKLLKEELKLINSNNSDELLKLVMTARVLGKGKGTPMLRNGIHCIGAEPDEESEASDFPGFK